MANIHIDTITQNDTIAMPRPHDHPHYELYFLLKGTRLYLLDDVSFTVSSGSVVVVPPKLLHMTSGGNFERTLLRVFPEILTPYQVSVLQRLIAQRAYRISNATLEILRNCFQQMSDLTENDPHYDDKMFSIFSYLIFLLETDIKEQNPSPIKQKKLPLVIYQIIEYIDQNYNKKISLAMIAEHFNYSVSYIKKQFKKYNDCTLYNYILELRIKQVKRLLTTTTYRMEKIAELCGFPSSNYLSLIFKKKEGISPLAYRKLIHS